MDSKRAQSIAGDFGDRSRYLLPLLVRGRIKWFKTGVAYRFVAADGLPDVFLHARVLYASGFVTAREGAGIVCEAVPSDLGLRAIKVLMVDDSTAVNEPKTSRGTIRETADSDWLLATVKWYNRHDGIGFAAIEGEEDVLLHAEVARCSGIFTLSPAQKIWLRYYKGPRGLIAAYIRPDGRPVSRAKKTFNVGTPGSKF
jgi:CspA family cold shock protein